MQNIFEKNVFAAAVQRRPIAAPLSGLRRQANRQTILIAVDGGPARKPATGDLHFPGKQQWQARRWPIELGIEPRS